MKGAFALASGPSTSLFTGTSLHIVFEKLKFDASSSQITLIALIRFSSCGMKIIPKPTSTVSLILKSLCFDKYVQGIEHKIPAPSPESLSPPQPPLCSIQSRPRRDSFKIQLLSFPLI